MWILHDQLSPFALLFYMLPGLLHWLALNTPVSCFQKSLRRIGLFSLLLLTIVPGAAGQSDTTVPDKQPQPVNDYSVRIFSTAGEALDWNLTPASLWLEVDFTRQVARNVRQSSEFQILQLPEESSIPVSLSWNRAGTFLKVIPLEPFKPGCEYQLRFPGALALNSEHTTNSTDSSSRWKWTIQPHPPAVANGFVMHSKRLLPQPRAIQWTTFSFWSADKALLTDSTGGIFVVDLHPISGEILSSLEVARLTDQTVSATAIRTVPWTQLYDFIFTTVPSTAEAATSSDTVNSSKLNESRVETGTLHRWRFKISEGNPGLDWVSRAVLIDHVPFIRSIHPTRPLGALAVLDQSGVILGLDPISSRLQNTPFDPAMIRWWEKISSSVLEAPLDPSASRKTSFPGSYSEKNDSDPDRFFVTGIFNPSLIENHSESGITIALSSGTASEETCLAPEGPTSPSIQFQTPGRYLFRLQRDGYYGFPNSARSEFVANGGNPTPSADPWEEPAYPVGVLPLKSFQSEDIFQLPFTGTPISLTQIQQPHPLAGRFLIGVSNSSTASGGLHYVTLNPSGGYLNSSTIYGEDLKKLDLHCHWLQQRPGTEQIYALGFSAAEENSPEFGLWVMSPSNSQ